MKLNILRLLIVALACVSAFIVITKADAQKSALVTRELVSTPSLGLPAPAQTPAAASAPQEKTTEQVQKNIKVLNGLPQSQLIPVMNFFSASLGVRCNFCHVNNNGVWAYDSDEKPEKGRAREMIAMVLNTNKTTFKGGMEVSCYTCHRGTRNPVGLPPLPLPLPSPKPSAGGPGAAPGAQASPTPRPAMPSADELINKYVAAIGGQAAIDKLKTRVMKGNINTSSGLTLTYEIVQAAPDRAYENFAAQHGAMERAVNLNMGWEKNPQGVHDITGPQLADLRLSLQLFRNLKLKEQYTSVRLGGKDKIGERDVYVIMGTTPDKKRERLFFDAETGLLLRRISYTETMISIIPEQTDFEDYREVDGVKLPFTVRLSAVDAGNPVSTRTFTEIKLNVPVDDSKFNKPAATKPNP
jgi:hypothetical protein